MKQYQSFLGTRHGDHRLPGDWLNAAGLQTAPTLVRSLRLVANTPTLSNATISEFECILHASSGQRKLQRNHFCGNVEHLSDFEGV